MNILSGRWDQEKPDLCLNGYNIYSDYYKIQSHWFVPEFPLHAHISVYQNLLYNLYLHFLKFRNRNNIAD
jgi:hypothetical protein